MPSATETIALTAHTVETAGEMPNVCVRHGLPATRRVAFAVKSKPELETTTPPLNPLILVGRLGEWGRKLTVVRAAGWPLCARCARIRIVGLYAANLLFWGGLLTLVIGIVLRIRSGSPDPTLLAPMAAGIAALLGSVVPFVWGSLPRLTQAHANTDATAVYVERPHPSFAAGVSQPASPPEIGD